MLSPIEGTVAPDPTTTRSMAEGALQKARAETGLQAEATNIMDQMHSFSVRAPQEFIDALSKAPQVARVLPNEASGSAFIAPVRKRSVQLPD